ncbi:MAG: DUF222 domain-containing protein [Actinomycetota bacterium]
MQLESIVSSLRAFLATLDTPSLDGREAARMVEQFAEAERLAAAGRTLVASRVQQTRVWRNSSASSVVAWMAARTGSTFGRAAATLNTALRLEQLPATRDALIAGKLSETQASEIVSAASADPASEERLLEIAATESVASLREKCRDVKAAASGDEDARERIRRSRYFRHWTADDGALRLDARLTPDEGAPLLAVVRARADGLEREARRAGQPEPSEAYAADALVSLVDGKGAPKTVVHVHVSQTAFARGNTVAGETCRIPGVGPITVGAARRLAGSGTVKLLESDGVDVRRIAHRGRTIPSHLRTALEARDPTCVVPGCNKRRDLEIDHIVPFAAGGETVLSNLARLCRWHHAQKTHHGWRLEGEPGAWRWVRGARARAPNTPDT